MSQLQNGKFYQTLECVSVNKAEKVQSQKKKNKKYIQNIELIDNLDECVTTNVGISENQDKSQKSIEYTSRDFQNSNLTKFVYGQILVIKLSMMMMTVISIVLSLLSPLMIEEKGEEYELYILILHTLISISLVIFSIMKSIKNEELVQKQLIRKISESNYLQRLELSSALQVLFLLVHPNLITRQTIVQIEQPINGGYFPFEVNKILQIIMMVRIYLVFSAFLSSTTYLSTRASRICRIYGTQNTTIFGLKCIFNERPLSALLIIFNCLLFVLANMVKLSESYPGANGLNSYKNSLWCVVITMGTVGYGDYSPTTYLGRIILFSASIFGIIMSSLLILTLSTYLSMQLSENKSHITLQRLILRENMEKLAKEVIGLTAKMYQTAEEESKENDMKELKKKSDEVHHMNRKIKNLIDTNNINEQMSRFFECLSDNMYEIYERQVNNAMLMEKLKIKDHYKINDLKFSFTNEIEKLIKER